MAQQRLQQFVQHLTSTDARSRLEAKSPDDVVITLAIRTPLTKAKKGGLKDTVLDDLLYSVFKSSIDKSKIDPSKVDDICVGNVLNGKAAYVARAAALAAGFPNTTALSVCNRWCSSGLLSVQTIANAIKAGSIEVGLAVGAESMSLDRDDGIKEFSETVMQNPESKDCTMPMGWTSENVSRDFGVSREKMDAFAARSFQRAEAAQKAGRFDEEIAPVHTTIIDPKTGEKTRVVVDRDDGIRPGTTAEGLGKIRSAFPQYGPNTTGGNASQVTDGAAAVLLMKRSTAEKLGQPILAKFVGATVAALAPRIMGIGPSLAIPKLMSIHNFTNADVDLFEINEAFASMAVYCEEKLGIDPEVLNVNGGAIALGHPLGCTGARQIATGISACKQRGKKVLVTSMCIGLGMGMASLIVVE
ncbi:thiolase [Saitoella complicata NRRL Y-17804]|nr:thiolase [Saitoella complicata NRRL Y-17804]ODQ55606.1 thiolase [Saitoella complicata NRRL Y-17804]